MHKLIVLHFYFFFGIKTLKKSFQSCCFNETGKKNFIFVHNENISTFLTCVGNSNLSNSTIA